MDKERLKACRSCGSKARLRTYRTYDPDKHYMINKYYVWCGCGVQVPELGYEDKNRTIDEWNEVNNV